MPWTPPPLHAVVASGWDLVPPVGGYAIALAHVYRAATERPGGRVR